MNSKPFTAKEFKKIYSRVPRLCVDILLLVDGNVVLTKRKQSSYKGKWHVPGGTVLYRENLKAAVKRIARYELGVVVTVGRYLGVTEYLEGVQGKVVGHSVALSFVVKTTDKLPEVNIEGEQIGIFDKIPRNFVSEQKEVVSRVLDGDELWQCLMKTWSNI